MYEDRLHKPLDVRRERRAARDHQLYPASSRTEAALAVNDRCEFGISSMKVLKSHNRGLYRPSVCLGRELLWRIHVGT